MMLRRNTRHIQVGAFSIGGDAPIVVQAMCNTQAAWAFCSCN